jgi:hypothetical protein
MNAPVVDTLAERVGRLERENRRLKRTGFAVVATAGLVVLMGQAAPKTPVIETQRVVITDEEGNERIVLGAGKDRASILLKSESGSNATAVLGIAKESAGLSITDEAGKIRVNLGKDMRPGGSAGLWLCDEKGGYRYTAAVDRRGPSVVMIDENGKPVENPKPAENPKPVENPKSVESAKAVP